MAIACRSLRTGEQGVFEACPPGWSPVHFGVTVTETLPDGRGFCFPCLLLLVIVLAAVMRR